MSGDGLGDGFGHAPHVHIGDRVDIHGDHNIGIQHNSGPAGDRALPPEAVRLFAQLAAAVAELAHDGRVREEDRRRFAAALPVLTEPAAQERSLRQDTLYLLAGLAQRIGEIAAPALGLANQLLALISG
ncbi:hypothetical protein ACFQ6N_27010 [Kitasatospora sp. NPDC056446]|uniref:hypothetical protein n=1 Tax=Kitasatospora sp. NPDC056446 TaxID=3345819 RepID=UPI0036C21184